MKIVTWNVNSVRARLPNVIEWIEETQPDVILLQEIKCQQDAFPYETFEDLGYNIAVHGQKTFNGVAILSKTPLEDITRGLPTFPEDPQARYIEAVVSTKDGAMRVASVYVPNGQAVGSDKFAYKMTFLENLRAHLNELLSYDEAIIIGGDYNIAPTDQDVHDPVAWHNEILCSPQERQKFQTLLNTGYHDGVRLMYDDNNPGPFSWWDYRSGAWQRNNGLRIDHLLLSSQAVDKLKGAGVDAPTRAKEKASDHAPVWCEFGLRG